MSIKVNDNIRALGPKPLDSKYFNATNIPYADSAEVLAAININERHEGLKVRIGSADYEFGADKITLTVTGGGGQDLSEYAKLDEANTFTGVITLEDDIITESNSGAGHGWALNGVNVFGYRFNSALDKWVVNTYNEITGALLGVVYDIDRVTGVFDFKENPTVNGSPLGGGAVDSVNDQTGVVVLDADGISDTETTNKFVTAAEKTKLTNTSGTNTGDQDLSGKVDKVVGKGLSANDFTDVLKSKLDAITETFTTALKTSYDSAVTWITTNGAGLIAHLTRTDNPHGVTKTQVGLSNVDNTSDAGKPVSIATQAALDLKFDGDVPQSATYSATFNIDFSSPNTQIITLTGNITFTTSNRANGKNKQIIIKSDASTRTFTFPSGWKFLGVSAPVSIPANKVGVLYLPCFGAADVDVLASYSVTP